MRLAVLILLAGGICSGVCLAQTPTTLPAQNIVDVKLDSARLKTWGTRRYTYWLDEGDKPPVAIGSVSMTTAVADKAVTLDDTWELTVRGKVMTFSAALRCANDSVLSPEQIDSAGKGDDEVATYSAQVKDGIAVIKRNDKVRNIAFAPGTLTDLAFYRVVTLLPRTAGQRYALAGWFEVSEINMKANHEIECIGPENVNIGGKEIQCTKFVVRQGDHISCEAWVDADGVLPRFIMDGRKRLELDRDVGGL